MSNWIRRKIKWIKNFVKFIREYETRIDQLETKLNSVERTAQSAEKIIRDRTDISVDVSNNRIDPNYIFVAGRYKNRDWVELYSIRAEDFVELVDILRKMQKYASVKRADGTFAFRGFIERELRI